MLNKTAELNIKKDFNYIPVFAVLALLLLRFPFLILTSYNIITISKDVVFNVFLDATYLFTALWIWVSRHKLGEFHIGFEAILLFILIHMLIPLFYLMMTPFVDIVA